MQWAGDTVRKRLVIDTSILFGHTRNHAPALAFMDAVSDQRLLVHGVGAAEMLAGVRDTRDLKSLVRYLSEFELVLPSEKDFTHCMELVRTLHLSHQLGWPDALIASTCLRLKLPLATTNVKHFSTVPGLRIVAPG